MLQAFNEKTGDRINIGDPVVSFRGEPATLDSVARYREPGYSGKVYVRYPDGRRALTWHNDNVWGLVVRDIDPVTGEDLHEDQ